MILHTQNGINSYEYLGCLLSLRPIILNEFSSMYIYEALGMVS